MIYSSFSLHFYYLKLLHLGKSTNGKRAKNAFQESDKSPSSPKKQKTDDPLEGSSSGSSPSSVSASGYKIPKKSANPFSNKDPAGLKGDLLASSLVARNCPLAPKNVHKFCSNTCTSRLSAFKGRTALPDNLHNLDSLCSSLENLVIASKTSSTWSKHFSAWNCMNEFLGNVKYNNWPFTINQARAFTTWALTVKKLSKNSVVSYLYSIKLAHTLDCLPCPDFFKDEILKMILKGAKNIQLLQEPSVANRLAMSLDSLLILGHWISECNWIPYSKQTVWTACLVSFFSSCRMGELLPPSTRSFDPNTTLLWKHISFNDEANTTIFLPFTKTRGLMGELIELFEFNIDSCCPVAAIHNLRNFALANNLYEDNKPVFSFKSGKFLTTCKLNDILSSFSSALIGSTHPKFSCHSFRAAIPTLISSHPNQTSISDIMEWGRWRSDSYKLYLKMDKLKKKSLFDKVSVLLINSMS